MKKTIIALTITGLLLMTHAQADQLKCTGIERSNNKTHHFILDFKSYQMIVDGDVFNISYYDEKLNAVYSENFIRSDKISVYDVFVRPIKGDLKDKYYLIQYDLKTKKVKGYSEMSCYMED